MAANFTEIASFTWSVADGSLLFLMHLLSKMRPYDKKKEEGGSRIGIVLNGSPLFTGGAGSSESEIRRWIIENDWLEAIVALPTDMFYNTDIDDAKNQYRHDRNPKDPASKREEPLLAFKRRALVHFAMSTDEVWMTTELKGKIPSSCRSILAMTVARATRQIHLATGHRTGGSAPWTAMRGSILLGASCICPKRGDGRSVVRE